MSNSSTQLTDSVSRFTTTFPVERGRKMLAAPIRFVGFWAAVSLPFLYLPLLAGGLESSELSVFAGLLLLNLVAFVVGHEHRR
ncbi:hypothetical protein SAMN04487949_1817 [Halogranum gelatinilyticum]|uniref:Uncharacterized protein n=1 Tax=Halogranum gelatinilyticum TaxID=660521 RepID=A0A1G9TL97_9EURY|nr:hypothetical protein [Halogranum gelatinilyticum]SDM48420.1 hypothetical protein SAMN04487949_1817 [Halogranum gelatinilyticum]